jgi:hypothetical protein
MQSQESINSLISQAEEKPREEIYVSVKEISSLANLGTKSTYTYCEKNLFNTNLLVHRLLQSFKILPVLVYKSVAIRLTGFVIEYLCQKIIEVRSFNSGDIEALIKLIQPLMDYNDFYEAATKKVAKTQDVFLL